MAEPLPLHVPKDGRTIRDMFAGVAPRYDLLNHLLSGWLDLVWRRRAARELTSADRSAVLDLCCGTGDQITTLARQGAGVVGADFCVPMLALAQEKLERRDRGQPTRPALAAADALALPFPERSFTAATVSFGLRNVADLDRALGELARTLVPGGKLVILEFAVPRRPWIRGPYLVYFRHILPRIGSLLSPRGSAYDYLPDSVLDFPQRAGFTERMERVGLTGCRWRDLTGGIVCLYTGRTSP
jgi:demethylmenaquinone methyltransferase/2-methoxy-6-polyprenyl-1,4-benzoquinol methylase